MIRFAKRFSVFFVLGVMVWFGVADVAASQCDGLSQAYENAGCLEDGGTQACPQLLSQIQAGGCQGSPLLVHDVNQVEFASGLDCNEDLGADLCIVSFQAGVSPFYRDVEFLLYYITDAFENPRKSSAVAVPLVVDPDFKDYQKVFSPDGGYIDVVVTTAPHIYRNMRIHLPSFSNTDFDINSELLFVGDDGSTYHDVNFIVRAAGPTS